MRLNTFFSSVCICK